MNYSCIEKFEDRYVARPVIDGQQRYAGSARLKQDCRHLLKNYVYGYADGAGRIGRAKASLLHAEFGRAAEKKAEVLGFDVISLSLLTEEQADQIRASLTNLGRAA